MLVICDITLQTEARKSVTVPVLPLITSENLSLLVTSLKLCIFTVKLGITTSLFHHKNDMNCKIGKVWKLLFKWELKLTNKYEKPQDKL